MMPEFLEGIDELQIVVYPSSWGRLQCNAKYRDANHEKKEYHAWAGRPEETLTMQMIVEAINLIDEQIYLRYKGEK